MGDRSRDAERGGGGGDDVVDRPGVITDRLRRPLPQPGGQPRPGRDGGQRFGERLLLLPGDLATPLLLAAQQHRDIGTDDRLRPVLDGLCSADLRRRAGLGGRVQGVAGKERRGTPGVRGPRRSSCYRGPRTRADLDGNQHPGGRGRPVPGDEGGTRRLLPDRGGRPRRSGRAGAPDVAADRYSEPAGGPADNRGPEPGNRRWHCCRVWKGR